MRIRQQWLLDALRRVQLFLITNAARLGVVNTTGVRASLDATVAQVEALGQQQDPTRFQRGQDLVAQQKSRAEVRDTWMRPIARIAQSQLRDKPEFDKLLLPPKRASNVSFLEAAQAMVSAAAQYQDTFIKTALPVDFVAQFTAAIEAYKKTVDARERANGSRVGATALLATIAKQGAQEIKILDALIGPTLATADDLQADWDRTKRLFIRATAAKSTTGTPGTTSSTGATGTNTSTTGAATAGGSSSTGTSGAAGASTTTTPAAKPAPVPTATAVPISTAASTSTAVPISTAASTSTAAPTAPEKAE